MILPIPQNSIPIQKIKVENDIEIFMKREDLVHPQISGNKYWKLFHNVNSYLSLNLFQPKIITFGGAFSNHIAAVSAVGKLSGTSTLGIIRGEELLDRWQENPTLQFASKNGMEFRFVTREEYRDKNKLAQKLEQEFPDAIIIPEGGTNEDAVQGVKMMLNNDTKDFDYLCTAVGTGGTIAGISKYCEDNQQVIGFKVVRDDSLDYTILALSNRNNFILKDASYGGYGRISDEIIQFTNEFKAQYHIPLEPVYTAKMIKKVFQMVHQKEFPKGSKVLCFHTGGLQGIGGANLMLKKQNRQILI